MSPERYQQVCELFHAVCDLPTGARAAYLDRHIQDDVELRAAVETMLAQDDGDDDSIASTSVGFGRQLINDVDVGAVGVSEPALPASIGPFKIIQKLGEGGMGVVYEAEQAHPHRHVALKVLRPRYASGSMLRRFQHEIEIQARLNHPGIGHVYEAGIEKSSYGDQPYFAMELLAGRSITRFAREEALDVNDRLQLMIDVADAVQHAHDHGIIHRDLKPANIVVQSNGKPKVLDFGIARMTDPENRFTTIQTAAGQLLGTIPYMSPEQITGSGAPLDHRSDVYSLGVLLYELLADQLPFDLTTCSIPQAAMIIQDEDPPRLSSINVAFRGEIETVVMTALEKSPAARYPSARALADDLRHILHHEPVSVKPPTTLVQLRRFARRNKPVVVGVAAVMLTLVIGVVVAARFAYQEYQQRSRAEQAQELAQEQTYRVSVAAAAHALDNQNVLSARRLLREAPERYRGWEWSYLQNRLDSSTRLLSSDHKSINALRFIRNDKILVARSRQSFVVWEVETGNIRAVFEGDIQRHAVVSPDGAHFAFVDNNGEVVVAGIDNVDQQVLENTPPDIRRLALSSGNDLVALASASGQLEIRSVQDISVRKTYQFDKIEAMAWSPTRAVLAARTRDELLLVDASETFQITRIKRPPTTQGCTIAWGATGRIVYLADVLPDELDGHIFRFDTVTDEALPSLVGHTRSAVHFEFDADKHRLLTSSPDGTSRLWNLDSGELLRTYRVEVGSAFSGTIVGDGAFVAIGNSIGTVKIFDIDSQEPVTTLTGHESPVQSIAVTSDGQQLVAGAADGSVRFWSLANALRSDVLRGHDSYVYPVTFSPDGSTIASASWDETVRLWDKQSGQLLKTIPGHSMPVYFLAFARDGEKLVSYGHQHRLQNQVIVDDLSSGSQYRITGERQRPGMAPAFHDDGKRVWLPRAPGATIRMWDYQTGSVEDAHFAELHYVSSPLIHHDTGRVLSIAREPQTAFIVDLNTGKVVHELIDYAMSAHWSPDGAQVVVVHRSNRDESSGDRISVWNAKTGEFRGHLFAHVGDVFDARFSRDGTRIFTAGRDEQIRIWDSKSLTHLVALGGHTEYVWNLAFDPTGRLLVSSSGDKTLRLWRAGDLP